MPQALTEGGMCGRLNRVLTCPSYVSVPRDTLFYILSSMFGNKTSMITMVERGLEEGMTLIHSFLFYEIIVEVQYYISFSCIT